MPNANIVDHIGSKVTVWTKDGNAAENRMLHTVDEFGVVISNQHGQQTFIPWVQVKYIDYPDTSPDKINSYTESPWWLKDVSTKELSDELCLREGVREIVLLPGVAADINFIEKNKAGWRQFDTRRFTGPATILVNQD